MARPGRRRALRQAPLEFALEETDPRAGELIERLEVLVRRDARVRNQQDAVPDVVEREHRVERHEDGLVFLVRRRALAIPRGRERRLEPGGRVVAEVADRATGEPRQARHVRRPKSGHDAGEARR